MVSIDFSTTTQLLHWYWAIIIKARDWPDARGIWHNEAKNFLVWINEEDHLRVISMEKGGNIKKVFTRFCDGLKKFESNLQENGYEIMWNEHLGYVLTCPSNLGKFLTSGLVRSTRPQNLLGLNQTLRNWYPRWCPLQTRQPFKTRSIRRNLDQAQTPKERNWWCWYRCRRWCKYFEIIRIKGIQLF